MSKKKKGIIIGIISGVVLLVAAVVIVVLHFLFMPQIQVVEALSNTLSTASESAIDKKYGGYELMTGISSGTYDLGVEDESGNEISLIRDTKRHQFQAAVAANNNIDAVLYVDGETSIIGYNSKNIQIDYTDDMAEKAGDSVITKLIGLKSSTVTQFAEKYVDTMEALSGTAEKTNSVDQLYERTKSLVLDLESEKMDKESFTVNGKKEKCQVYRITFNAEDMVDYVEDCYELSGAADGSIDFIIENILNCDVDDLYSDAREKAESIEDIDVYFAVNNKKQLVSMYSDNINNTGINVRIDFLGGDYLCDEVLFTFTKDTGESFTLRKDDISEGDYLGEMYEYEYIDGENKSYNGSITYSFEDDEITLEIDRDGSMNTYSVDIVDYKKGKYIELSAKGYDIYIGSEVRKIEKPEGDTLNLLNTDILSAYSFFSDFLSKDN